MDRAFSVRHRVLPRGIACAGMRPLLGMRLPAAYPARGGCERAAGPVFLCAYAESPYGCPSSCAPCLRSLEARAAHRGVHLPLLLRIRRGRRLGVPGQRRLVSQGAGDQLRLCRGRVVPRFGACPLPLVLPVARGPAEELHDSLRRRPSVPHGAAVQLDGSRRVSAALRVRGA